MPKTARRAGVLPPLDRPAGRGGSPGARRPRRASAARAALEGPAVPADGPPAELRSRVFRILVAWLAGSVAAWNWREEIFGGLLAPATHALGEGAKLQAIAPTEIFFTYMQCALLAGFFFALPVFFWQAWAFVAPGLYANEKKVALPFVLVSTSLFVLGGWFGHTVVFPVIFTSSQASAAASSKRPGPCARCSASAPACCSPSAPASSCR